MKHARGKIYCLYYFFYSQNECQNVKDCFFFYYDNWKLMRKTVNTCQTPQIGTSFFHLLLFFFYKTVMWKGLRCVHSSSQYNVWRDEISKCRFKLKWNWRHILDFSINFIFHLFKCCVWEEISHLRKHERTVWFNSLINGWRFF